MSEPRRITIDFAGNIYEVEGLIDRFANDTEDPMLAISCVIKVGDRWVTDYTDNIPIYTVH